MPHVTLCRKLPNLSESVVLVPKSIPDLSAFIFRGCEILFDLITIPTWCFGTGNGEAELLNKKSVSGALWSPLPLRAERSRQGLGSFYI